MRRTEDLAEGTLPDEDGGAEVFEGGSELELGLWVWLEG